MDEPEPLNEAAHEIPSQATSRGDDPSIVLLGERNGIRLSAILTAAAWELVATIDAVAIPVDSTGRFGLLGEELWQIDSFVAEQLAGAARDDPAFAFDHPVLLPLPSSALVRALIAISGESRSEAENRDPVDMAARASAAAVRLAAEHGLRHVLVPLVGTGSRRLETGPVAQATIRRIRATLRSLGNTPLTDVYVLASDAEMLEAILAAAPELRPREPTNDLPVGDDLLDVRVEAESLADILMLRQLKPPLAVGILGGWGTGKSFVMRLMRERMNRIRSAPVDAGQTWPDDPNKESEYVGHVYQIDFNAWTYAHSDLWSALMQTIFAELNRQLSLEKRLFDKKIDPLVGGDYWRVLNTMPEDQRRAILESDEGLPRLSPADATGDGLWERLREVKHEDQKRLDDLEKSRDEVKRELADLQARPGAAFAVSAKRLRLMGAGLLDYVRQHGPAAAAVVGVAALVPFLSGPVQALLAAPPVVALLAAYRSAVRFVADKHGDLVETQVQALQQKLAATEAAIAQQRRVVGPTADYVSVADFVDSRLRDGGYDERLGLMRQVHVDLANLTASLSILRPDLYKEKKQKNFPRGPARVVLYIDDLDRCPPRRVVQVFEAIQLLLTTQLFVVVVALDLRYVSRALEKVYGGILSRFGEPSGLDYIEKIIQIPYRTRPVRSEALQSFLGGHLPAAAVRPAGATPAGATGPDGGVPGARRPTNGLRSGDEVSHASTSRLIEFSVEEAAILRTCCAVVNLSPRAIKRLVNVSKLVKLVWARSDRPDPTLPVVGATSLLLVLATRHGDVMRGVLTRLEQVAMTDPETTLLDAMTGYKLPTDERYLARDHALWRVDVMAVRNCRVTAGTADLVLGDVTMGEVLDALDMASSFSFLGDIGYEPDLHVHHSGPEQTEGDAGS